jgi:hypothetical protein
MDSSSLSCQQQEECICALDGRPLNKSTALYKALYLVGGWCFALVGQFNKQQPTEVYDPGGNLMLDQSLPSLNYRGTSSDSLTLPSVLYYYLNLVTNKFYAPASYAKAMASPHHVEWR